MERGRGKWFDDLIWGLLGWEVSLEIDFALGGFVRVVGDTRLGFVGASRLVWETSSRGFGWIGKDELSGMSVYGAATFREGGHLLDTTA